MNTRVASIQREERWEAGGEWFLIRPIRPADAAKHNAFFHRLSPEDIRLRFFAAVRELTPAQLDKFPGSTAALRPLRLSSAPP